MGKPFCAHQHRHQKRGERGRWLDLIRRSPADRHTLPKLLHEINLAQVSDKNRHASNGVTARPVSRRISRSSDKRASASGGTQSSPVSSSILHCCQRFAPSHPPELRI